MVTATLFALTVTLFALTVTPFALTVTPFALTVTLFAFTATPFALTVTPFALTVTPAALSYSFQSGITTILSYYFSSFLPFLILSFPQSPISDSHRFFISVSCTSDFPVHCVYSFTPVVAYILYACLLGFSLWQLQMSSHDVAPHA